MAFIRRYGWIFLFICPLLLMAQLILHQAVLDDTMQDVLASSAIFTGSNTLDNIVTCAPNTKIPSRVIYPAELLRQPSFEIYEQDFMRNRHLMKDQYIIFRNPSTSAFSVYCNVHKTGSTTMENLSTPKFDKEELNRNTQNELGSSAFNQKILNLLKDLKKQESPVLFTFARDPVLRFVSGLQQVISMPRRHIQLCPCDQERDPSKLMDCVLDKIEKDGSYLDQHLAPQTFEMYSAVRKQDIGVQILPLTSLDAFVASCSTSNSTRYRVSETSWGGVKLKADDVTPELRKKICKVYHIDVMLFSALGGIIPTMC